MSSVLSVRIPKKLKEEARRLGIDIRRVVEESLRKAIMEEKKKRIAKALKEIVETCNSLSIEEWVNSIRNARKGRSIA